MKVRRVGQGRVKKGEELGEVGIRVQVKGVE